MAGSFEYLNNTFGASEMTWGPGGMGIPGGARTFLASERFAELDRREAYYACTQHDHKSYDFDGRMVQAGKGIWSQPLLTGDQVPWYVPMRQRRPSHPYRLSRVITGAFTNLLFGSHRFPTFRSNDARTQDFTQAVVQATRLPQLAIRARNVGGSVGTVGWSWGWSRGKPSIEVHNGKYLFAHSWEDRHELIPRHVSKITMKPKDEYDGEQGKYVRNWYWFRQDWLPDADIVFHESKVNPGEEPIWLPDPERSAIHGDHKCHFVWTQNLPTDDIDGENDYEGLYENFDALDMILSVAMRGVTLNCDPTLVLKMDLDQVMRMGVKKGSDNALTVGTGGDAKYMEMQGSGIMAALETFKQARASVLEVAQCVVADPDKLAASGISSVALKAIYSPMTGKVDILRDQYGAGGTRRVLNDLTESGRAMHNRRVVWFTAEGQPYEVEQYLELPTRIEQVPIVDDDGNQVGEQIIEVEREPGKGQIDESWGPYFLPTPDDQQKSIQSNSMANGGKPVLSQQTAAENVAQSFGIDPAEEWKRIQAEKKADADRQNNMLGDVQGYLGGKVVERDELPDGASTREKLKQLTDEAAPIPVEDAAE